MRTLLLYCFILATVQVYGQQRIKKFVQDNYSKIRTVEPDSIDFSDLEAIGNAIGDSRIVMLGEQDHGDAPTFLAKTRLIKYLHEKKGFNVLAFESDFFALNQGWNVLPKQKDSIGKFIHNNIFSIWSNCKQCENLFYAYIPDQAKTGNPIVISGFDVQTHGAYSKNLKKYLTDFLKANSVQFVETENYKTKFLSFIDSIKISKNLTKLKSFSDQIDTIINQVPKTIDAKFEMLIFKSLKADCKTGISFLLKESNANEFRDWQMSENLKWLVTNKYPNEKIIVWAHNAHIVKNNNLIKPTMKSEIWLDMAHYFTKDSTLNAQTYILGFNSKSGRAGRLTMAHDFFVDAPVKNGFEYWIKPDIKYAFVDFKRFNLLNANSLAYFNMKGRHHKNNAAIWTQVYDGIFYIRDMYPCEKIN